MSTPGPHSKFFKPNLQNTDAGVVHDVGPAEPAENDEDLDSAADMVGVSTNMTTTTTATNQDDATVTTDSPPIESATLIKPRPPTIPPNLTSSANGDPTSPSPPAPSFSSTPQSTSSKPQASGTGGKGSEDIQIILENGEKEKNVTTTTKEVLLGPNNRTSKEKTKSRPVVEHRINDRDYKLEQGSPR